MGRPQEHNDHAISTPDILNEILVRWKAGITMAVERRRELNVNESPRYSRTTLQKIQMLSGMIFLLLI